MKATAIYFSPAGGTQKAIQILGKHLENEGVRVQYLDITGDPDLFPQKIYDKIFQKVEAHDLLLVGGPVYINHLHYNVLEFLQSLPPPDGKWADKAVAVASFGKILLGVVLAEAAKALSASGRLVLAGLNIDAAHCTTRLAPQPIGAGLPGPEIDALCRRAATDIADVLHHRTPAVDSTQKLARQFEKHPNLQDEREVIAASYPMPSIDEQLCNCCLDCVAVCPVRCIQEKDGSPFVTDVRVCIHCSNCLVACPMNAIPMDMRGTEAFLLELLARKGLTPTSPSRSEYIGFDEK